MHEINITLLAFRKMMGISYKVLPRMKTISILKTTNFLNLRNYGGKARISIVTSIVLKVNKYSKTFCNVILKKNNCSTVLRKQIVKNLIHNFLPTDKPF